MNTLADIQNLFANELISSDANKLDTFIRSNGLTCAQRIQVYRNNVIHSLTEALRVSYPVVENLVGSQFFNFTARRYIEGNPSRTGNLSDYGDRFSTFLADFQPAQGLPYLPDIARLEWARQVAYHAADALSFKLSALQAVPQERYDELRFQLHPSARLIRSDYPVLRIWEVNQPDYPDSISVDLNEGPNAVLVIRRDLLIEMDLLSPGDFQLLDSLANGRTLTHACEQALESEPGFDAQRRFCHHVTKKTIVGFSI